MPEMHWYYLALTGSLRLPDDRRPHGIEGISGVGLSVMLDLVAQARKGWLIHMPRGAVEIQERIARGGNSVYAAIRELCGEGEGPQLLHEIRAGKPRVFQILRPPLTPNALGPVPRSTRQIEEAIASKGHGNNPPRT